MALAEYGNALNIDTDGSGRPILIDPDSGDTIAVYDRSSGAWQVTTIEATTGNFGTVDSDSVNTDELSTDRSYRAGNVVVYNQNDKGPYLDAQDAADDVPNGGTFVIAAHTYDVPSEGTVTLSEAKTVRGEGYGAVANALSETIYGTVLDNSGADAIDAPAFKLEMDSDWRAGSKVGGFMLRHEGASPGIILHNAIETAMEDVQIRCYDSGQTGVKTTGEAFFLRADNVHVRRPTDYGFNIESAGSDYWFNQCRVGAGEAGAVGIRTTANGTYVVGGSYSCPDAGVLWDSSNGGINGGGSFGVYGEKGTLLAHRSSTSDFATHIQHFAPRGSMSVLDELTEFDGDISCTVAHPSISNVGGGGELVSWGAGSTQSGVIASKRALRSPCSDSGAELPYKKVVGPQNTVDLGQIDTADSVPVTVPRWVDGSAPSPAFYDGADWYELSSAASTFTV